MSADDQVAAGRAAWQRLQERERKTWADWIEVARALAIGRAQALRIAGTNRPLGSRYNVAMGAWLVDQGMHEINNQMRYRALLVLENLPAISAWREGLDDARRRRLNHPNTVWHAWRRDTTTNVDSTTGGSSTPRTAAAAPRCGYGRAVHWPSDALRRAAAAIREAHSSDVIILARKALEAAIRNEADLLALLDDPKARSAHKPGWFDGSSALVGASTAR